MVYYGEDRKRFNYIENAKDTFDYFNSITMYKSYSDVNFLKITNELSSLLMDMFDNHDKRFIDSLVNSLDVITDYNSYSNLFDQSFYKSVAIISFTKLYFILKTYEYHKDDYNGYMRLFYDIIYFKGDKVGEQLEVISNNFKEVKEIFDSIASFKYYGSMSSTQRVLEKVKDFVACDGYFTGKYLKKYKDSLVIFKDAEEVGCDLAKAAKIFDKTINGGLYSLDYSGM